MFVWDLFSIVNYKAWVEAWAQAKLVWCLAGLVGWGVQQIVGVLNSSVVLLLVS